MPITKYIVKECIAPGETFSFALWCNVVNKLDNEIVVTEIELITEHLSQDRVNVKWEFL